MRPSLQRLMKRLKRETVFIIGGGPSARNVDFSMLMDETVVCINDAYRDFPDAAMIYWVDDTWASENMDGLNQHKCDLIFTSRPGERAHYTKGDDPTTLCNTYVLKRTGEYGFDPSVDCIMGNNSGAQVLNLVVNMKPKRIVLIGYDMRKDGTRSHYHNQQRPYINEIDVYNNQFTPSVEALSKGMANEGSIVEIINDNENSAVRCFPFHRYTEFLTHK